MTDTGIPYFPQTLPGNTVIGRLESGAGPTEAIPFAVLAGFILSGAGVPDQIITTGNVTVLATDQIIVINKSIAGATSLQLPTVNLRSNLPLWVFDWTGLAGDMTFLPSGTEKIMGVNASWIVGSGGVPKSGGSLLLIPSITLQGWLVR